MKEKIDKRFIIFFTIVIVITILNYFLLFDAAEQTEAIKTEKITEPIQADSTKTDSLND